VTPYLISSKCGSAFGKWVTESLKLGGELSKESIIRTVTSLEIHPDLKLTSSRQLPGFLITTTLNLPPSEKPLRPQTGEIIKVKEAEAPLQKVPQPRSHQAEMLVHHLGTPK
jgi:hypothetical protein